MLFSSGLFELPRGRTSLTGCCAAIFAWSAVCTLACAEEPTVKFLARLRDEGMYDIGLKYLDIGAAKNRLPASIKDDLPLERNILMQESIKMMKTPQQRDARIADIEKGYKDFLAASPNHPRRSEAQTKLGDLLLSRAQSAIDDSKKEENKANIESLRTKARGIYTEAQSLYANITQELKPILESMAGDKIKATDTAGKELRERYRGEYRQSQLLEAKMMEFISQTYEPQSAEWTQWLTKSETALSDLIDKTNGSTEAGWRMLALLYRGEVQSQLAKIDAARDSFSRVADTDFKTWRIQAVAGIVRLDSTEKSGKYEAAIEKGEETLKHANANDRLEPTWLDLQLAIAEARMAYMQKLDPKKEEGKYKNNRRLAREMLQNIAKRSGPHQVKAKKMLNDLGIETVEKVDTKIPDTKNFADAIKVARERLERGESAETTLPILEQQLAGLNDEAAKASILEQIQSLTEDMTRDRKQAIEVYGRAMRLFKDKDSRDDLLEAKFLMSYLLFRTEQYWECIAVAQELLVSGKGTEKAQRAGSFAQMAVTKLIAEATPERQIALVPTLERLAHKLIEIAPDSEEGKNAIEVLVKVALINKRYNDAEKFVAMGNGKGGGASLLGQLLWSDYRAKSVEHRNNKTEMSADELGIKDRAEKLLRATWDNLNAADADKSIVMGINTLANIYLSSDRIDEALMVLDEPTKGALHLASTNTEVETPSKLEGYRLKLQAMVQAAGKGSGQLDATQVSSVVSKMKELSAADESQLTRSLSNLAIELKSKLDSSKEIGDQTKLGNAFGVLIHQLISVSSDINTLDSAGNAIYVLADNLSKSPATSENAKQLMVIADEAFSKVATKSEAELTAAGRKPDDFQFKLGRAKSGSGKFEEAHKVFVQLLTKSPSNLTIQVEAARNLQLWANGKNVELLNKAYRGTEPGPNKKNLVWGWGQISQVTSSRITQFKDVFFEARLGIAKCLRMIALTETDASKKKLQLEGAVDNIRKTYKTYPELGGPEHASAFVKLLIDLQQDQGQPTLGLAAFKSSSEDSQSSPPK